FSVFTAFLAYVLGGWVAGQVGGIRRSEPARLAGSPQCQASRRSHHQRCKHAGFSTANATLRCPPGTGRYAWRFEKIAPPVIASVPDNRRLSRPSNGALYAPHDRRSSVPRLPGASGRRSALDPKTHTASPAA